MTHLALLDFTIVQMLVFWKVKDMRYEFILSSTGTTLTVTMEDEDKEKPRVVELEGQESPII
jgi:hypothetical protein